MTAVQGTLSNVIFLILPLCFNKDNAVTFLKALDEVLTNSFKDYIAPAIIDDLSTAAVAAAKKARLSSEAAADTVCATSAQLVGNETDDTHSSITTLTTSTATSSTSTSTLQKLPDNDYDEMD